MILNDKHQRMLDYLDILIEGKKDSFLVSGPPGSGKSFTITEYLEQKKMEYEYHSGFSTPLSLYNFLYNNRNALIVFDDTISILENKFSLNILFASLWPVKGKRIVSYSTTSGLLKAPSKFEFKGKIAFVLNDRPGSGPFKVFLSRVLHYNIDFSHYDFCDAMLKIAGIPHTKINRENREMIANFIIDNSDETTLDFSLRTQSHIETIFMYKPKIWEDMAKELLSQKSKEMVFIKKLMAKGLTVAEHIKLCQVEGISRGTYFRYKNKLKGLAKKVSKSQRK